MSFADSINGFKQKYFEYKDTENCPFDKTVGNKNNKDDFIDFKTKSQNNETIDENYGFVG